MEEIDLDSLPEIGGTDDGDVDLDSLPEITEDPRPLDSADGGDGKVVQMSRQKPGPRALSATAGHEEKIEQVSPNVFLKGDTLFDSEDRTVKPGQLVTLSRNDGTSQLLSFNGANKNGKPVFEDVRGVSGPVADIAGRIEIGEDDFDAMLAGGKAKRSRSPLEQVRLGLVADTGDEEKYAPGFVGTARAVVDRVMPYAGRHSRDLSIEQLKHLANIHEGKLDGYAGKDDDERLGVAAADAGLDYIRPGETREAYSMRIRAEADEMLKKRSMAREQARAELGKTEASAFDKIAKGGIESGGYALEFALPGGVFGKAGKVLGMGRKALRVVSALGSAVPVVAAESRSRYIENTTPEYGVDEHGELKLSAAPDSEGEAAYKAIGGAVFDTAVEIGLESATMGLLRLVGKPAGMALGKMTPSAVKDLGERTFNRFMASETGAALRSINRARQDFTSLTQINSPFGELMEENVQAFGKVLNLDGKTSEYKGFEKELKDYWDRQADWDTQWDIFYGLVAQLAIGAAKSTSEGLANRVATADARRDVRMALARSGISEEAVNSLTTKQQKVLTEMWRRYSADPDALKDRARNLGVSMRAAVDELVSREGIDMARSLEQRGIAPEKFEVQVGADGKPAFRRMNRFSSDGKSVPMNAMVDEGHGVTIVDQGDGTFYVMNDQRGFTPLTADGFAAAKRLADNEVMDNQRRDADNEKKARYLANLAQRMYAGRNIKAVPTEAALRWGLASAFKNGETPFGLVDASQVFDADGRLKQQGAGGFHTPDGTVVVILDNVESPSEMERVLAHEATGHEGVESNTGRGENTVEFIRNAKAEGFERYKAGERARYVSALVKSGMGENAANAVADEAMSTDSYQKEAMARYAQGRLHRPTWYERKKHEANEKRRADGESVPFDQADMEVMLARAEEEGRSPGGKFDIGNADSGVRYFETEQEASDETGNVRDEAQAQPEQGPEGPEGGEAARPVEAQQKGGEAPRHGAVEAAKTGVGLSSTPGARKSAENRLPTASAETGPNKETPVAPSAPDPVLERPAESTAGEMVELSSFRGYRIKGRSSVYGENAHKLRKEDLDELERRVRAFIKIDGARRVSAADTWNNAKERDYYKAELALSEFEDAHPGTVSLDMISNGPQRQTTQGIKSAIEWLDGKVREDEEKNDGRTSENDVSASEIDRDAEPDYMSSMKKWLSDSRKRRAEFERRLNRAKSEEVKSQADTTKTEADGIRGTGENVPEVGKEAPTAMKTEHDFLRVMHDNQKPVRVPVGEISIPDTQFKEGADPKTGVVKGQELKGEYFESAENAVVVYVRKDGTKELVTGRHRFDLAKRNGKNDILARVFREADGYTPEDMRNLDAISNIIDEKGTEHDYIRYFENAKPSRAAAEAAGFLSRSKGRLAFELYEGATEDTRAAIDWSGSGADGLISPEQAGIIAKAAPRYAHPRNGAVQRNLVKKAQDGLRGDRLAIVARSLAEEAKSRKAPAADGVTQLDLFTSEEDLALLALEEKRAAMRVKKANEYGRVAGILQTAMQKGGRLDLNKAYAKELGIRNPNDRKQLADARQKALEKEDYWRNSVRLDEADKAAIDAEINAAADDNAKKLAELKAKREAAKIGKQKVVVSKKETTTPADETKPPAVETKPVEGTQDRAPKAEAVVKTATDMPTSEATALLETEKERYIAFRGAHNDFDKAFREAKGDLSASGVQPFVEELKAVISASPTKELQRRDKSLKRIDTGREDDSYHHVRQMISEELKRRENGPVSAPKEAGATTPQEAAKPSDGRKSGDTGTSNGSVTPQQANAQVAKPRQPSIRMKDEAAEKLAQKQEDELAALFDTPDLGTRQITVKLDNEEKFFAWAKKWNLDPSKKKYQREWAENNGVSFDTPDFDPDVFQKRVGAVAKLVKTYKDSGVADFKTLATRMAERFPEKFDAMKPYLRGVWNAVADQMSLSDVSRIEADRVFGTIEAQAKEVEDGADTRGQHGVDAAEPATSGGEQQPGGVLADGPVREQNPDGRVDGQRSGNVPGLGDGVAEGEASERGEDAGGEAAGGTVSVGDTAGSALGESRDGADSVGNGHTPGVSRVKKSADKAADSTKPNPSRRDFVMTKAVEDAILEKNAAQRARNNIDAIKLVRDMKARDYAATPGEQATLAKFVGWGGLREKVFGYALERAYDLERTGERDRAMSLLRREGISQSAYELHKELRQVLNDKEYESAKASASTAFYTPVEFVRVLHETLRSLGVKGGRFLGPSAGTGNFASAAGAYEKPVNWQFVEKDAMTGELLKALFPNQRVTIGGFEETKFPDGFFDFAIDNVPYADVPINDRSLSSRMFKIHDYFFAKTLAKLRPGGVMAFLTSTGTLDKTSPILRQFLTEHGGKIVGAVRLPNGFFSENAGTDVASDLVIVQKVQGRPDNSAFEKGVEYGFTTEWVSRKGQVKKPITYNGYFKDNPEQIVGTMEVASGRFGPTLQFKMPEGDMWGQVRAAVQNAFEGIDHDALLKSAAVAEKQDHAPVYDKEGLRQGNVTMKDGKPFIKSGEMLEPIALPNDRKLANELKKRGRTPSVIMDGLLDLRKAMRDVIDAQMADNDMVETDLAPLLAKLNEVYDAFVKKNGTLHDKWVSPFALLDKADGNRMLALERVEKDESGKQKIAKSDIFTKRVISRGQRATKADTPKDALVISYSESGAINVPRIAELLGVGEEEAVKKLKEGGDAFENPQTGRLEPSWEYLSGRVRAKLAAARAAVEAGEESYRANVEALEKVQPPMVRLEDAEIKFGATWVDPECMKDFLRDAFGAESMRISLGKNEVTGQWNVDFGRVMNEDPWGETSWSPQEFVSRVLNHGSMNHYDTDPVDKKRYLNERKTEANKLAAEKLHSAFSQFIQSSDKWASPMYERYNSVMTDMVEIRLPNNVLPFRSAGMSDATLGKLFEGGDPNKPKKGREYQSAVIARGVLGNGSLCLAHCVGAGKTLEMQSIGVLGRHLGLFKKPMYVVPNHMLEQFTNEFVEAFPNANILKMSDADVKPENRRAFFAQVANGDWDAIVVKHSTFSKKLAMSDEYQKEFLEARIRDLDETIAAMREDGDKISVDQANKKKQKLQAKLEKLMNAENHDSQIVPFEELGVDQLFVDEAHNFKGMEIETRQGRTGGLSQGDSQRAIDMQMKTQYVQSLHGGDRGVVFATGTPLSNAPVVEAYVMLKYLAPNKLEEQGLKHFDDFVDAFGRITTESEFSLDGKTVKEKDKVSAFVNIPELMKLLRSVVDIVNPDQLDIPRPKPKYHMIDVDMSPAQEQIMEMVAREAAIPPSREDRNKYLTLTRVAKNACLTPRLLGFEDGGNKIIRAVAEIKRVYDETADNRGAQLVFTDIFNESTASGSYVDERINYDGKAGLFDELLAKRSGGTYNLNEEIRDLLVAAGIPKDEIAIIQDIDKSKGDKDANKGALFAKVRAGEVRVLIGSRPKMGEGTNVQERLAAIHLLHPGWKPSEDEQAIGRIIRFGNTYKEGQIFYYLTKGNANIGSYETKNHQLIGVKSKLIDQVMHGDDTVREIDMDESAMDRDMLMGLASGNKALMELIDVKKRVHKLELNTESTLASARRNKDKAEANSRILERRREEFAREQEGAKEWREKNEGKPFTLSTPDGRSIEKVKDMAEYVSGEMAKLLTKDRYDRAEMTVLGDFNGIELVLAFDRYGDEKFRLAVPLLGVEREINYSGFVPDFSQGAMTAFKGKILETVSPDYAKAYENSLADMDRQAKKMSADADRLQKDYEQMRGELIKLRTRQAELEREVTPLVVQAVADRKVAAYGNWIIAKPVGGQYVARRESDAKSLSAPTVKELIPLMDAEDFASQKNAATKTVDLSQRLKPDGKGEIPMVNKISVADVDFDTPELSPAEQAYVEADDKTPTEQVMREVYGMTNDEIATAMKAAGMEPPKHVRKPDETAWKQAEALLSNPSYMAKLSRAVAKFPRNIADYENNALNVLFRQRQAAVNAAQTVVDGLKETLDAFDAIPKGERDADFNEEQRKAASEYAEAKAKLAQAKALMNETGLALTRSSSEAGRRLRSNRGLIDQTDLSYAGISGRIAADLGGADKITPEMDAKIREIAGEFASLDEEGRDLATARLKAHAEKIVEQIKRGNKVRKSTERKQGDEAKRVMRNYNDAMAQIEVGSAEVGGTLVGLSDQQYPAWGKWLRAIGEFHCFENPDITEEECVRAIVEDISPFMDGVDENQVRDALTGFGHNFRQSRYDAQRLMNDLRSQARLKRQMDWMDETNTMPPLTGMVRDEPSDTTRNLQKQVQDRKKEVPDAGRDERRLKGVLESAKTRVKNRIADLERAIETGERIPGRDRTVTEDVELRELKKRKDELQKAYDELFKTERGLTDEQRVKLAERLLGRELEHALADLDRARSGDFSKRPKRPRVESPTIDALRDRLNEVREQIRELKKAKYEFGMTPEELAAYNARKMANREKVLMRLAERIVNGDIRQKKKPQPPMPPEMQKRYDAMGEQMKRARQKLADMRLEAGNATIPSFWRKAGDYLRFVTTAQRALRATMDFSAVLRQSARITLAHPVMGAKAFGKAWNAAHSEANLLEVNDEIMSDPSIQEAVAKYGLNLREVDATSARDVEMFHGMERNKVRILGKEFAITDIPFFGEFMLKSERHYITYLNAMSAELYSSIVNDRTRFPAGPTAWQKKMVADMINVWNGSAALSKERRQALQKAWVNDIFWAPQLAISRIQSAALYDVWHPLLAKGVENADGGYDAVSAEERKTMFRIGASEHFKSSLAMIALGAFLKWLFADEDDWYDFGQADWFEKLLMLASPKIGNTTIDLTGGEQSVNRAAHKIWKLWTSGKVRTGSGRMAEMGSYGGPTVWGVIGRYVQGKTSPSVSELVSLIEGRDYVGNEYTWKDAAIGAVVPLTFEDVKDQLVQNGVGKSLVTIPLSLLGAGGSTYDRKVYENAVNRFLESKKEYDAIEKDHLLDEANRKLMLDSIVSDNPLMREEVREEIAADIAQIRRDEAMARKDENGGNEPDAYLLSEIETSKAKLIEKIRSARRR